MNLLVEATPNTEAFQTGYVIGIILGLLLLLGLVTLCVVAVVKAFTRRTRGWIVAGSIGGVLLLLFGVTFAVGFVHGFVQARQGALGGPGVQAAPAVDTTQVIRGRDFAYQLTLPPGWATKRKVNDFDLIASRRSLYFGVIAEEGNMGGPENVLRFAQDKIRAVATEVQLGGSSPVRIDGHDWLTFTVRCQIQKIPFAYQYAVYAGPEGSFQLIGWTLQNLFDRDVGTLRDLAATFHFPPAAAAAPATATIPEPTTAPTQVLVGDSRNYKLTVPVDWTVKHEPGVFDLEVSRRSAFVGVTAEARSLGTPQALLTVVQDTLRKNATELQISAAYAVVIDGRNWLQFNAKCKLKDVPLTYHCFVYAGPEGSYGILGWSLQNLYDRDADQINAVATSFQFPPPAAPAPAAPARAGAR